MAEKHDIGELWATVQTHGESIDKIGKQVEGGFASITSLIRENQDKTDRKIDRLSSDTDTRISAVSDSYQRSARDRNQNVLTISTIILTALFGIGGLLTGIAGVAATVYTFTKQPIDQSFATQGAALNELTKDVKRITDGLPGMLDAKLANYVPKGEVQTNIDMFKQVTTSNTARIDALEKGLAVGSQERSGMRLDITRLDGDVHELRESVKRDFAGKDLTLSRFTGQDNRMDGIISGLNEIRRQLAEGNTQGDRWKDLSNQLNSLRDNFITRPPVVTVTPKTP